MTNEQHIERLETIVMHLVAAANDQDQAINIVKQHWPDVHLAFEAGEPGIICKPCPETAKWFADTLADVFKRNGHDDLVAIQKDFATTFGDWYPATDIDSIRVSVLSSFVCVGASCYINAVTNELKRRGIKPCQN